MDNKKKHRSGFQKRKWKEELLEELKKLPKINSFQRAAEGKVDVVPASYSEDCDQEENYGQRGAVKVSSPLVVLEAGGLTLTVTARLQKMTTWPAQHRRGSTQLIWDISPTALMQT